MASSYTTDGTTREINEKFFCNTCSAKTFHQALTTVHLSEYADGEPSFWTDFLTIQCKGCNTICFAVRENNSENVLFGYPDEEWPLGPSTDTFYPEHIQLNPDISRSKKINDQIKDIYRETASLISREMYRFAALGLRLIIEEITKELGAQDYTLAEKIKELFKQNIISEAEKEILLSVKDFGDGAAHKNIIQPKEILENSLKIIETILIRHFLFPEYRDKIQPKKNKSDIN